MQWHFVGGSCLAQFLRQGPAGDDCPDLQDQNPGQVPDFPADPCLCCAPPHPVRNAAAGIRVSRFHLVVLFLPVFPFPPVFLFHTVLSAWNLSDSRMGFSSLLLTLCFPLAGACPESFVLFPSPLQCLSRSLFPLSSPVLSMSLPVLCLHILFALMPLFAVPAAVLQLPCSLFLIGFSQGIGNHCDLFLRDHWKAA